MRNLRTAFVLLTGLFSLVLISCVTSPLSRTQHDSTASVSLSGFLLSGGQPVHIAAVNQSTGALETITTPMPITSSTTGMTQTDSTNTTYTLYPWSANLGVLPSKYWSPQSIVDFNSAPVADLQTAQGHAELFATTNDNLPLSTFSPGAAMAAMQGSGGSLETGSKFSDGLSVVLFDQNGVGSQQEGPWNIAAGMSVSLPGFLPVTWSVGSYTVDNGPGNSAKQIYALICAPTSGGPYPVVIFNHGGTGTGDGGNINGNIVSGGGTAPPSALPDSLGQCIDWAKRGWVFATSAYRGESVIITAPLTIKGKPGYPKGTWNSQGKLEFCLGEVTDVLALTDLVVNQAAMVHLGPVGSTVSPNVNKNKVFMYGYSHGGCITWRAVEQGAPVTAFSVIEGFTDLRLTYLEALSYAPLPLTAADLVGAAVGSGAYQAGVGPTYQPNAAGVMGYNWRSAHYFASRGDLSIQKFKQMPILILHGDNEVDVTLNSMGMPVTSANPTPLAQPALIANDIGATNIFVGPTGTAAPTQEPCAPGAPGAALASPSIATCNISFVLGDTNDPCVANGLPLPGLCNPVSLTPPPSNPTQSHYLVVFHNMNHINGGNAILNTFSTFVQKNFGVIPGCNGLVNDCATD